MTTPTALRAREDSALPGRLVRSIAVRDRGVGMATADFPTWFAERRRSNQFQVNRIPFAELQGWTFNQDSGNLAHDSGRFFTVEGLHVTVGAHSPRDWQQPIIVQPEVGILGILVKEFDGVLHFLMQAKMEPGNPNLLQLSPTVQATRSNYTKVHRGADVRYIEYFTQPDRGQVLADVLQSEHGAWFFRKANRNMIVEAHDEVPVHDDFCWLTLGQIGELLRHDNVVNMDARTVLACTPTGHTEAGALHSDTELLSWITAERSRHELRIHRIPLGKVADWTRGDWSIEHVRGRHFRVVAVDVTASNREVTGWTQPLFEPIGTGITAMVTRRFDGVPHLLLHARVEGGFLDTVELGPTVQYIPENYGERIGAPRPLFADLVLEASAADIRYRAVHSEEGGRFLNAENRCLIVHADETQAPADPPSEYRWVTPGQLNSLVRHGRYVNVQARTLLSLLNTGTVQL